MNFSRKSHYGGHLSMMTMLAITAFGAVLGFRFKVFVLVPAIALSSVASWGVGIAHGNSFWSILLATFFVMTALQIGYFAGIVYSFWCRKGTRSQTPVGHHRGRSSDAELLKIISARVQ